MARDLISALVRVLKADGTTAGTGFVVTDDGLIVTCAHVVDYAGVGPGGTIRVLFPASREHREATVDPTSWRAATAEDIAILQVAMDLPPGSIPLPLGSANGASDHPFATYGFPPMGPVDGMRGGGTISGLIPSTIAGSLLQLTGSTEVTPGFSGAPILDTLNGRVVGMVSAITSEDQFGRLTQTAFGTPTECLRAACPRLRLSDVCPFRSLEAFTEADAAVFFGRQRLVDRILESLRRQPRFLTVLGPSGSGKSSVVQAGLIPEIRLGKLPGSDRWEVVLIREYDRPLEWPGAAGVAGTDEGSDAPMSRRLTGQPETHRLVLVLDQFEGALQNQTSLHQVAKLLDSSREITVILVMRDDFYSRFAEQAPELLPWVERGGIVNVPRVLERDEVTAMVAEPARVVGLRFEEGLVDDIVDDAMERETAEGESRQGARSTILPLLEFALTELWERRQDGILSHEVYDAIGGVTGGLSQWADRTYNGLDWPLRPIARRIFTELVSLGDESHGVPDSKRRRTLASLYETVDRATVDQVVRQLTAARLVVAGREAESGLETVELIHEALLREWSPLRQWLTDDRRFLAWHQEIERRAAEWVDSNQHDPEQRDAGRLLRGRELAEAEGWLNDRGSDLAQGVRQFAQAGVGLRERELEQAQARAALERQRARRARQLSVVLVFLLALVGVVALFAFQQRDQAQQQQRQAEQEGQVALSHALALEGTKSLGNQLDLALLLGVEATTRAPGEVEGKSELLSALQQSPGLVAFLHGHTDSVPSVAFSPNGKILATGSADGTIRLWDMTARRPLGSPLRGHQRDVLGVAFSPDGTTLASGSADGSIRLWKVKTRQPLGSPLKSNTLEVSSVAFSPDGTMLASGYYNGTIEFWDVRTERPLGPSLEDCICDIDPIHSVAFSPDGRILASGSGNDVLQLWDVKSRSRLGSPLGSHGGPVSSVAFSPNGKTLASGSYDHTIQLWNVKTRKPLGAPLNGQTGIVWSVAFSPDGTTLASGNDYHTIRLWDVKTRQPLGTPLHGQTFSVISVAFSPDGTTLVSGNDDGTIQLWDIKPRPLLSSPLKGQMNGDKSVAFSPDGRRLVTSGDRTIRFWDVKTRRPLGFILIGQTNHVTGVAFSPNGKTLASVNNDGTVQLWNARTRQPLGSPLYGHAGPSYSHAGSEPMVAFSPTGRTVASGSDDGTIRLWNVQSRRLLGSLYRVQTDGVASVAFSPDGTMLATVYGNGTIEFWDVRRRKPRGSLIGGQTSRVYDVAFSPDGRTLASVNLDDTVQLWDVQSRRSLGSPLNNHPDLPSGLAFRVIGSTPDYSNQARSVAFSPDGSILAVGYDDGSIRLWNSTTRTPLGSPLKDHGNVVSSVAFSPNGRTLASASWDNTVRLWDLDLRSWERHACQIANRNLKPPEWHQYIDQATPRPTCPGLPS